MGKKELTPAIRFKGFTDPWEQRKLEQISTRVTSIGHDLSLPRIEYEDIVARRGELKKEIAKNISLKIGILFAPGDVLYGKLRPYLMHWLHPQFSGVAVGDFWVFRPTSTDSSFFYCLIQSEQFQQAAAVSIGSKMPRADWKYVSEFPYLVPKQIHEQQNIGLLFEGLELYIALHQRKLEKLQRMKQALLEKLFPKNGAVVPELRFNGFTDAWEQRKLGDLGSAYSGMTGKSRHDFGHGDARYITYLNVFSQPLLNDQIELGLTPVDRKQTEVKSGDALFTISSEVPEEIAISAVWQSTRENVYLNSFCFGVRPYRSCDSVYFCLLYTSPSPRD